MEKILTVINNKKQELEEDRTNFEEYQNSANETLNKERKNLELEIDRSNKYLPTCLYWAKTTKIFL